MERILRLLVLCILVMFGLVNFAHAGYTGPTLKLPMQPGNAILCTVEAGGRVAPIIGGGTDTWHTDAENGYYAIDFDDRVDGDKVVAAASGTVTTMVNSGCSNGGTACQVKIDHGNGYVTTYYHLKNGSVPSDVYVGATVSQGQVVGIVGSTGEYSTGPHLHFSIKYNGDSYSTTTGLSGVELDGTPFADYVAGSYYQSTNDGTSTCTTSTSSYEVRMVTVQDNVVSSWYHTMPSTNQPSLQEYGSVADAVTGGELVNWQVSDVNGDGYDDLIQITKTDSPHTYAWVYTATGNGGFMDLDTDNDGSNDSWKRTETKAKFAFVADMDDDDLGDLILGYRLDTLATGVAAEDVSKIVWKICPSTGVSFDDCTEWVTDNTINSYTTFGDGSTDTFLVGDVDGDGLAELLRGRPNDSCTEDTLQWKLLISSGSDFSIKDCWGYPNSQFRMANVDDDTGDELLHIRTDPSGVSNSEITVFVGHYANGSLTTSQWVKDVGNTDGWYDLADMNYDIKFYPDLIRWSTTTLAWMENQSGASFEGQSGADTLISDLVRSSDDWMLFGTFGDYTVTTETCTTTQAVTTTYDSYPDLLVYYPTMGGWWLARNSGTTATYHANLFQNMYTQGANEHWYLPVPNDFSGDGYDDLIIYTQAGDWSGIAS
ncbi:MAG: M23 family metallopeptidase, partial [Candidatus Kerfeldbacteria bacterium]|nr:M23 family metallopeptidase [Candidatus Kerfeldbacteria bacterium]